MLKEPLTPPLLSSFLVPSSKRGPISPPRLQNSFPNYHTASCYDGNCYFQLQQRANRPTSQPKPHTEERRKNSQRNKLTIRKPFSFSQPSFLPLLHRSHEGVRKKEIIRRKEKKEKRKKEKPFYLICRLMLRSSISAVKAPSTLGPTSTSLPTAAV